MSQEKTESGKKKFNRDLAKKPPDGFAARLSDFVNNIKVERQRIAEVGGVTPPSITAYCSGKSQPAAGVIAQWVKVFRLNANWLLAGEGEMLLDSPPFAQPKPDEKTPFERNLAALEVSLDRMDASNETRKEALLRFLDDQRRNATPTTTPYACAETPPHNGHTVQERTAAFNATDHKTTVKE